MVCVDVCDRGLSEQPMGCDIGLKKEIFILLEMPDKPHEIIPGADETEGCINRHYGDCQGAGIVLINGANERLTRMTMRIGERRWPARKKH